MKNLYKAFLVIAYLVSIVLAVWAVGAFGVVPVGFGFVAPAAVYVVGITLVLRDLIQESMGKWVSIILIVIAAIISLFISPSLALASGLAFIASELLDLMVFTRVRSKGLLTAILASNAVSLILDSIIFLTLAFGSLTFLPGQIIGKIIATIFAVVMLYVIRYARTR